MIYDNYFLVPDKEMCKPVINSALGVCFSEKSTWTEMRMEGHSFRQAFGKWETHEKTITITEREFDEAVKIAISRCYKDDDSSNYLRQELFK